MEAWEILLFIICAGGMILIRCEITESNSSIEKWSSHLCIFLKIIIFYLYKMGVDCRQPPNPF